MLRVGIITNAYPPNKNGVSTTVYNLQKSLEKRGIKVFVVTPKIPYKKYPHNVLAISSAPLPKSKTNDLRYPINLLSKAKKFFVENNVDIIHTHDTFMGGMEGVILGFQMQIPVVHTYHTLYEYYEYFNFIGYKSFIRSFSQIVCDCSNNLICLSDKVQSYLRGIGVVNNIKMLPNIMDFDFETKIISKNEKKVEDFVNKHNLKKGLNLINFGRVAEEKNIIESIKIVKNCRKNGKKYNLIIAGDGPRLDFLKNYIIENKMSDYVFFFGRYEKEDISLLCSHSCGFIITSFTEVLPTTPLEASFYSLPIFCINDPAYQYLLEDGVNGVIGSPTTLISALINIKEYELKKMGNKAKEICTIYLSIDFTQQYIDFYKETIKTYKKSNKTNNMLLNSLISTQYYFLKINTSIRNSILGARF